MSVNEFFFPIFFFSNLTPINRSTYDTLKKQFRQSQSEKMAAKISSIWRALIKLSNSHIARTCPSHSFVRLRQCAKRINCVVEGLTVQRSYIFNIIFYNIKVQLDISRQLLYHTWHCLLSTRHNKKCHREPILAITIQ